ASSLIRMPRRQRTTAEDSGGHGERLFGRENVGATVAVARDRLGSSRPTVSFLFTTVHTRADPPILAGSCLPTHLDTQTRSPRQPPRLPPPRRAPPFRPFLLSPSAVPCSLPGNPINQAAEAVASSSPSLLVLAGFPRHRTYPHHHLPRVS